MKVGIMQPYFFPYIGYFSLISAVDCFVFYDDAQHIRRGWIHRNRILNKTAPEGWEYIHVPLKKAPRECKICEVEIFDEVDWREKIRSQLSHRYSKAPFFAQVGKYVFDVLEADFAGIGEFNAHSIRRIAEYLGIGKTFARSSQLDYDRTLEAQEKLMAITNALKGSTYLNPIGGSSLYSEKKFARAGLKLRFTKMNEITYNQGGEDFVPNLSIIDVLMWNSRDEAQELLQSYAVIQGEFAD